MAGSGYWSQLLKKSSGIYIRFYQRAERFQQSLLGSLQSCSFVSWEPGGRTLIIKSSSTHLDWYLCVVRTAGRSEI